MANTIQEFSTERGIKHLLHFTRASNLASILQRGLVRRDILVKEGYNEFNDQYRFDNTKAVCLSISFPNYKMFWGIRQDNQDIDWVILIIYPAALWMLPCAFCVTNAASTYVTNLPLDQRRSLASLQAMYADWQGKKRTELAIPNDYPTNPQAEVLALDGIPQEYIYGAIVLNSVTKQKLEALYPGFNLFVHAGYFRYRKDYAHWKSGI